MVSCRKPWMWHDKPLAIFLYGLVTKLMGLKSEILLAFFLGTKTMKLELALWFMSPVLWKFAQILNKSWKWITRVGRGGWWIGVFKQIRKRSSNLCYLFLWILTVYIPFFQLLFKKEEKKTQASMNATTLSQQFINASHMQMLQHSLTLIHKTNFLPNTFPIGTWYHLQYEQRITYKKYIDI